MSSYSELIKNFEKIRAYMRDFYVYGFESRDDYQSKSARSYDDERRRLPRPFKKGRSKFEKGEWTWLFICFLT